MNYHIEHHMYRMVPFHGLPALHNAIKYECRHQREECLPP